MMIRQGDLLFVRAEIPTDAKPTDDMVLARGETTGHTHQLRAGAVMVLMAMGVAYIRVLQEAYVDHQDHRTVVLPPGDWKVMRQREYTPEGWRQVTD